MRTKELFNTSAFRLAAGLVVLFGLFAGALSAVTYGIVDHGQRASVRDALDDDIGAVLSGYQQEGIGEAQEVVNQLLATPVDLRSRRPRLYLGLRSADGRALAGNITVPANANGLAEQRLSALGVRDAHDATLLTHSVRLPDGSELLVGRDIRSVQATQRRILLAFALTALMGVLLAAGAGLAFGARVMRRTDSMGEICDAIVAGQFDGRVSLRGNNDELDRLGRAINAMLDRIEALLQNLQHVSSDIAHDLRTPLARLRHRLEQTHQSAQSTDEYALGVTQALQETDSLLSVFAALLRISQVEAGTRAATFQPLSLAQILTHLYELYHVAAEDLGYTLRAAIGPDAPVLGDAELLTQLFANLLENALKHTPRGSVITLALARVGDDLEASVTDSGPGIADAEREKVLQRFYRIANSRSAPGHGLGLALVSAIASLHRVQLTLTSASPGLCVRLRFPLPAR